MIQRLRDRMITSADLKELILWINSRPDLPEGEWFKDFGTFKLCGEGGMPKTFLLPNQTAWGEEV